MFGNKKPKDDSLPVSVHVVRSAEAFAASQKVWDVNARTLYLDPHSQKELLHFKLVNPDTIIWLQRDAGRTDVFELVMSWQENRRIIADVQVLLPGPDKVGDDAFAKKVLDALLTTPAIVPVAAKEA
jgi:hypothetical protein